MVRSTVGWVIADPVIADLPGGGAVGPLAVGYADALLPTAAGPLWQTVHYL